MKIRLKYFFSAFFIASLFFAIFFIFPKNTFASAQCCNSGDCYTDTEICKNPPSPCGPGFGYGYCYNTGKVGGCGSNADCLSGQSCIGGQCVWPGTCGSAKAPGCDGLCGAGSACKPTANNLSCVCKAYTDRCNGGREQNCVKYCTPAGARDGTCYKRNGTKGTWCWQYTCQGGNMTLANPSLLSPAKGATITTPTVRFKWKAPTNWGSSCNPPQQNSYKLFAGLNQTGNQIYYTVASSAPLDGNGNPYFDYTLPTYWAPGSTIYWHVEYSNNCAAFDSKSEIGNFLNQGGIAGSVYYDAGNTCSTAQLWNKSTTLKVTSNTGISGTVSGGKYSLGTVPGTYNLTLSGNPPGYICSTGCAQSCPTVSGVTSPGTAPNLFLTYNPGPWWQVMDADVSTNGDISSSVPSGLFFGLKGTGGFAGVPTFGGTAEGITTDNSSENKWLANSTTVNPKIYNYQFFINQVPSNILSTFNSISSGDDVAAKLTDPAANHDDSNYYWYMYDGGANGNQTLNIPAVDLLDRKVILFVNSADVKITGNVNLTNGSGFFMLIVGEDAGGNYGNISVDPAVGGGANANIKGIFVADNSFDDGSVNPGTIDAGANPDIELIIRGSVVAYQNVILERDLGSGNTSNPGEQLRYAPEMMLLFPKALSIRKINWKEVAP